MNYSSHHLKFRENSTAILVLRPASFPDPLISGFIIRLVPDAMIRDLVDAVFSRLAANSASALLPQTAASIAKSLTLGHSLCDRIDRLAPPFELSFAKISFGKLVALFIRIVDGNSGYA
jgi:hypothetical protein